MPTALPFGRHLASSAVIFPSPQPISSKASFLGVLVLELALVPIGTGFGCFWRSLVRSNYNQNLPFFTHLFEC